MAGEKDGLLGGGEADAQHEQVGDDQEIEAGGPQEGDGDQPDSADQSRDEAASEQIDQEARDMGWVPFEEWRGPKEAWKPADEFVRRGRELLPIVQSRARKAEDRVKELERGMQDQMVAMQRDFSERMAKLTRANAAATRSALQRQASALWQNFEDQKARAVEQGDAEAYNAVRTRQMETMKEYVDAQRDIDEFDDGSEQEQAPSNQPDTLTPSERRAIQSWIERNPWFNRDKVLTVNAQVISQEVQAEMPGLSPEENLRHTEDRLKELFPAKFGVRRPAAKPTQQRHAPPVEGGGRQAGGGARSKGFNDLPPEAKQSFNELVQHGIYQNDQTGRSKYAAAYWEA